MRLVSCFDKIGFDEWLRVCDVQDLVKTACVFARAGQSDALLFVALTRAVEERVGDFSAQDLVSKAWAFVTAGQLDASLFTALAIAAGQLQSA